MSRNAIEGNYLKYLSLPYYTDIGLCSQPFPFEQLVMKAIAKNRNTLCIYYYFWGNCIDR